MSTLQSQRVARVEVRRRPTRAIIVMVAGRVLLALLVLAVAWAISMARLLERDSSATAGVPFTVVRLPMLEPDATTVAGLLTDVRSRVERAGGGLIELQLTTSGTGSAKVHAGVDVPGGSAAVVDRIVGALGDGVLDGVTVRSISPVPSGSRLTIDAEVGLAAALADGLGVDARGLAVALSVAAERSGVDVRAVEVPERQREPVRVVATGSLTDVTRLVGIVETELSAPRRLRAVSLRPVTSGLHEVTVAFVPREDGVRVIGEVVP